MQWTKLLCRRERLGLGQIAPRKALTQLQFVDSVPIRELICARHAAGRKLAEQSCKCQVDSTGQLQVNATIFDVWFVERLQARTLNHRRGWACFSCLNLSSGRFAVPQQYCSIRKEVGSLLVARPSEGSLVLLRFLSVTAFCG